MKGLALALLLLYVFPMNATAQEDQLLNAEQQDIEEIEITGQRNTLSLRNEIRYRERQMFELYNDLNSNDDFDVACGDKTPTGSKLPIWQCEPAFLRDAQSMELNQMISAAGGLRNLQPGSLMTRDQVAFMYRRKVQQLNEEMKALAKDHPELAEAMLTLHSRRQQLEAMENAVDDE